MSGFVAGSVGVAAPWPEVARSTVCVHEAPRSLHAIAAGVASLALRALAGCAETIETPLAVGVALAVHVAHALDAMPTQAERGVRLAVFTVITRSLRGEAPEVGGAHLPLEAVIVRVALDTRAELLVHDGSGILAHWRRIAVVLPSAAHVRGDAYAGAFLVRAGEVRAALVCTLAWAATDLDIAVQIALSPLCAIFVTGAALTVPAR